MSSQLPRSLAVRIKRLRPDVPLPVKAHASDSGFDVYATDQYRISPNSAVKIPLGFALGLPEGYEAQLRPRSGLNAKGIWCALGTIDGGYRGELAAVLCNVGSDTWHVVKSGDRIAQLVVMPIPMVHLVEVESLDETERGATGFGASGQ